LKIIINKKKPSQTTNRFLINGKYIENPNIIAESFNEFFINIGQVLDKKIPPSRTNPNQYIKKTYNINIFLSPATNDEIEKIIDNLRDCATGWDNIPASILKDNKAILSTTLTHIINNSLTSGIFPR
jgi:hypothetical protein